MSKVEDEERRNAFYSTKKKEWGSTSKFKHSKGQSNAAGLQARKMKKLIEEATARSEGRNTTNDDDTDSVASSMSSFSDNLLKPKTIHSGISPLNRRRSLRLANKKVSPLLLSQNTVIMKSPIQTQIQWTQHRKKSEIQMNSQDTIGINENNKFPSASKKPKLQHGTTKWVKYRGDAQLNSPEISSPAKKLKLMKQETSKIEGDSVLLKKMSTTWGLRQKLGQTKLEESASSSKPSVDEVDSSICAAAASSGYSSNLTVKHTLKRKASTSLSQEANCQKKGNMRKQKTSRVSKQVTIVLPSEEKPSRKSLTQKRQLSLHSILSVATEECLLDCAKRMKIQQTVIQQDGLFKPPKKYWPINMNPQIVWTLPVNDSKQDQATAAHVDQHRCLVGHQSGLVIELNSAVTPSRTIQLPAAVCDLISDAEKVLGACVDGRIYDITTEEIVSNGKLVLPTGKNDAGVRIKRENDKFVVGSSQTLLVLDSNLKVKWQVNQEAKSNGCMWLLDIDDSGVYCGCGENIAKYSVANGKKLWETAIETKCSSHRSKPRGIKYLNHLYVANGDQLMKLGKYNGQVLESFTQGASYTGNIQNIAAGAGLIFVAGSQIVCYSYESGEIVYIISLPNDSKITQMQYFQARLFCLNTEGLNVLDFTENSIKTAMDGNVIDSVTIQPDIQPKEDAQRDHLNRADSVTSVSSETSSSAGKKPKARRGKLKLKAPTLRRKSTKRR